MFLTLKVLSAVEAEVMLCVLRMFPRGVTNESMGALVYRHAPPLATGWEENGKGMASLPHQRAQFKSSENSA